MPGWAERQHFICRKQRWTSYERPGSRLRDPLPGLIQHYYSTRGVAGPLTSRLDSSEAPFVPRSLRSAIHQHIPTISPSINPEQRLCAVIGVPSDGEHTVHEAELVGLLLGLHLIKTEKRARTTCAIGVDNQATIGTIQSDLRNPGQHIAREIIRLGEQIRKTRKRSKYNLTIRWVAGHEGLEGNELADQEAKAAARGTQSDKNLLPPYLRRKLKINPNAAKQSLAAKLSAKHRATWRTSERGTKMAKIDVSTPSRKFIDSISHHDISRSTASLIAQMRINHVPVNAYLYRFKKVESARCFACGTDTEDVTHFLLECPTYAHERWALARQAKKLKKPLKIETLLGNPAMTTALATYIEKTHRFDSP
ncbi:hypothetical protein BC826DRAFT_951267 [Russula brevipes]|nr:hypothetical protein BC826DRAFT_951267 [Russula brevipes]